MKFTKMHGAGNDFIILNNLEEKLPLNVMPKIAACLCARRTSLGADGLMVVEQAKNDGDFAMYFYNSDGSVGEMCGNGARCIARYGYENGLAGETQKIETTAGLVTGYRVSKRMYRVRLNDPAEIQMDLSLAAQGKNWQCSYVVLGVPHAVVPYPGLANANEDELRKLGRSLRWHKAFPKGANVNFYEIIGDNHVLLKTFERGVEDFTLACGTGSGSTAVVLALAELVSCKDIHLTMAGGDLYVSLQKMGQKISDVFLTGPTDLVASGDILDEDLAY